MRLGFDLSAPKSNGAYPRVELDTACARPLSEICTQLGESHGTVFEAARKAAAERIPDTILYLSGWRSLKDQVERQSNLASYLYELQASVHDRQSNGHILDDIRHYFKELTGIEEIEFHPRGGDGLNVSVKGRRLDFGRLGDGLSHLLMLAVTFARKARSIILLEEPKTHLHPERQRRLLHFVKRMTTCQVIMSTHSPVLLDTALVSSVFRVTYDGDSTSVKRIDSLAEGYEALNDLDVRASDILQANVVLWVEGPSDREFLIRCLQLAGGADLTEGIAYQFAYYGGSLRAHISCGEASPNLVNVLRLSRNAVIMCDSDRSRETDPLDEHKSRLEREATTAGAMYWVTAGRELENYLHPAVVNATHARLNVKTPASAPIACGRFEDHARALALAFPEPAHGEGWATDYDRHKVRLMREYVHEMKEEHLGILDLRERTEELLRFIRGANQAASVPSP